MHKFALPSIAVATVILVSLVDFELALGLAVVFLTGYLAHWIITR